MSRTRPLQRDIAAIVLGASAGGVEALMTVVPAIPAGAGIPAIAVLHLPSQHPSLLVDIFSPLCAMPVHEVADKQPIEPGHMYFAAPNYHVLIERELCFALSQDEPVQYSRPSIDVLFESAAEVYGEKLLAILLTGSGYDGTAGMRAVLRAGGVTVVQEPASAYSASMPQSALDAITPDYCLSLSNIVLLLRSLSSGVLHAP